MSDSLQSIQKVTLLKTGETFQELKATEGCYEHWFDRLFESRFKWDVVDAPYGAALPDPSSVEALVITGSPVSVYERRAWSVACSQWLARVWSHKVPTLGICYGHQLLADALGGDVIASPNGREMGAVNVQQTQSDPLFEGLEKDFKVWQTHIDEVSRLPDQAELIAANSHCPIQAMSIGDHCRTVQWHPEMNREIMNHYVIERRKVIDQAWGEGSAHRLSESLPATVDSGSIIASNFVKKWLNISSQ